MRATSAALPPCWRAQTAPGAFFANSTEEASESFARVGGVSGFLSLLSSAIGLLAATVTTVARSFMYGEKAADFQKVERELTELGKMLESYHRSAGGEPFSEQQWTHER